MKPLIIANWKMHTTLTEATILASGLKEGLTDIQNCEVVLCPPSAWLVPVAEIIHRHRLDRLHLGAQNIFWQEQGAVTGEIAASMLKGLASYVIIGHSERRSYFHETNQEIQAKIKLALAQELIPIFVSVRPGSPTKPP
jgi:triosephosphate isomerase (TIM)